MHSRRVSRQWYLLACSNMNNAVTNFAAEIIKVWPLLYEFCSGNKFNIFGLSFTMKMEYEIIQHCFVQASELFLLILNLKVATSELSDACL